MAKATLPIKWAKLDKASRVLIASDNPKEYDLGIAIAIGIRTGLRQSDLMHLEAKHFTARKGFVCGVAKKTKKTFAHPLPEWLVDVVLSRSKGFSIYSRIYSRIWLNRRLQALFTDEHLKAVKQGKAISSHTLRKSFGLYLYENGGINAARMGLQHTDSATTSRYLDISQFEQEELQAGLFC
jgi:integrase